MQACMPRWPRLLAHLAATGKTQVQIGAVLGIDQATVSRIASGQIADVRFDVGAALIEMAGGRVIWPELVNAEGAPTIHEEAPNAA